MKIQKENHSSVTCRSARVETRFYTKKKLGFLQHLLHLTAMFGIKIKLRNQALKHRLELGLVVKQSGWSAL